MSSISISCALNRKKHNPPYISKALIRRFVLSALAEDRGDGDHTSLATIPALQKGRARLLVKETGIIAGLELAKEIFTVADPKLKVRILIPDGSSVKKGDIALQVEGSSRSILLSERLVLNCMQRMSGIATKTNFLNTLCKDTKVRLLDTRKTTPNFRFAEKWAVLLGGGTNHRFGLFDMILVKDNHIDMCGGIAPAIRSVKNYLKRKKKNLKIEVEARTLKEVQQILEEKGVHRILLDNMSISQMNKAVHMIGKQAESEASGGITERNIRKVALTGVTYISIGALTHHVKSLDLSLKAF